MATVHNLEPQPTAKVILHTTSGSLSLELFAQQTPITSRNFLQLCLNGYYDNTIFHRLVPGFIIQGGDPTGTGAGGESSHEGGRPFADEFHSRLKFNRRGLLGMANSGQRDDNGSQFFLTLGKTDELNGKNTMFGRVEAGNTIFNLVKMGEAELAEDEGSERPMFPTRITGTEVLVNPFEDMVKKISVATSHQVRSEGSGKKKQVKKKVGKQLLSFGGGEEGEEDVAPVKAPKFNPQLANTLPEPTPAAAQLSSTTTKRSAPPPTKALEPPTKRRLSSRSRSHSPSTFPLPISHSTAAATHQPQAPTSAHSPPPETPSLTSTSTSKPTPTPTPMDLAKSQIAALKASLKRPDIPTSTQSYKEPPRSALEAMIPSTATRGRKRKAGAGGGGSSSLSRDEQSALEEFKAFKRKLEATSVTVTTNGHRKSGDREDDGVKAAVKGAAPAVDIEQDDDDEEAHLCDLHFIAHCQSCSKWDEQHQHSSFDSTNGRKSNVKRTDGDAENENVADADDHEDNGAGWMSHQLSFAKDRLGKDLEWKRQNERNLVVIDPREKEREIVGVKGRRRDGVDAGRENGRGRGGVRGGI